MRRIILYFILIAAVVAIAAMSYLAAMDLPVKIRMGAIAEIENITHRKVFLRSAKLDIVKGFVLEDIVLYDKTRVIARCKEIRFRFLIPPIFKNNVVIPVVSIESPYVSVEHRPDGSFSITELIPKDLLAKKSSNVTIYKIIIRNGAVDFRDKSINPQFASKIEAIYANIFPSLPAKINFDINCKTLSKSPIKISLSGQYLIPTGELYVTAVLNDLFLKELKPYYDASGFSFPAGTLDIKLDTHIKDGIIDSEINGLAKSLVICKDKITARLDSNIKAMLSYDLKQKQLEYAGTLDINSVDIFGIENIGRVEKIKARVEFNDSKLSAENIDVNALGVPWKVRINVVNFSNPILDIYASSDTEFSLLQKAFEGSLKSKLPVMLKGKVHSDFAVEAQRDLPLKLNGYVSVSDANITLGLGNFNLEHVKGEFEITPNTLSWTKLDFKYHSTEYSSMGILTNFTSPGIQLRVNSKDLSFKSIFALDDKLMNISELNGRYLNSDFSVKGKIDLERPGVTRADINGSTEFDLNDLKSIIKNSDILKKVKPEGSIHADFSLAGNIMNIGACNINAKMSSNYISLYDMKLSDVILDYEQEKGVGHIKSVNSSFYGGSIWATGKIDWLLKDPSYSFNLDMKDVKLERFKKDTSFKDKDVSGNVTLYANLDGYFNDISKLKATCNLHITKGRLWQLDLFKGLGFLIFTSDFGQIIFADGSCDFKIKDKMIFTNDIVLKSGQLILSGSGKIGFDKSVSMVLKSELTEEAMHPGFQKNLASAIGKYTYTEISGTLTDPKYKMRPNVSDMMDDLATRFSGQ